MFKIGSVLRKSFIGLDYRLFEAVEFGDLKRVEELIDMGANVNAIDSVKNTPLHIASMIGDLKMIQLLVDKKADINAINEYGHTPLWIANENRFPVDTDDHHSNLISYLETQGAVL